ncbi:MAG: polysaccharide deacetylase family protein [Anaerovoracaceae bacterium]|jgi:polysaccharide deacetylase family sporulation protein PdaB
MNKSIKIIMGGALALILFAVFVAAIFGITRVVGEEKKLPIYSVDVQDKRISISFDAAWGDEHTGNILDILDEYGVKTTFFLVDFWAKKHAEDVKEIHKRGHEVGNHSATHPDMTGLSPERIREELKITGDRIKDITGMEPTLFRPPFGAYNNCLIEECRDNGYHVIQWSVDSLDWKDISADQIVERVTSNIEPGDIILFHNNATHVEDYLPKVLKKLQGEGYEIVPIGQLIYKEEYCIDHKGRQISLKKN